MVGTFVQLYVIVQFVSVFEQTRTQTLPKIPASLTACQGGPKNGHPRNSTGVRFLDHPVHSNIKIHKTTVEYITYAYITYFTDY